MHSRPFEKRLSILESSVARIDSLVHALQTLLALTFLLCMVNLGSALWFFQLEDDPDWDHISITLTIFEVFLAMALVGGFWMLRSAAQRAAEMAAKPVAIECAEEAARESAEEIARRTTLEWLELRSKSTNGNPNSRDSADFQNMLGSLDWEDDESDGK